MLLSILATALFVAGTIGLAWLALLFGAGMVVCGFWLQSGQKGLEEDLQRQIDRGDLLELELAQQRRTIDVLADGLDVAVFICDERATILYANRRAMEMFRFDSPVGRSLVAVTLSYDLEQIVLTAWRERRTVDQELPFTYPAEQTSLVRAWPNVDENRVYLTLYEITSLRRLERIRQDFVANVSHELRTPLTVIRAMAETLLDEIEQPTEKQSRYLGRTIEEVDRLSLISNDLLILSTAESNPVRKHACDLADIVKSVAQGFEKLAAEKKLDLRLELPKKLEISANAAQMNQVAINLIENAMHYTLEGEVHVALSSDAKGAVLRVSDTGIGIASEHRERIFERFYRVDKGRGRMTGGTGLGLSIVRHIVEAHGGTVSVESELGRGSSFTARLPRE